MTGAALPADCDTVVPYEDLVESFTLTAPFKAGQLIHPCGLDAMAVLYKTLSALVCTGLLTFMIFGATESVVSKDVPKRARTNQVACQFFITVFLLIFLSFTFGGYFTPEPKDEGSWMDYSEPWE